MPRLLFPLAIMALVFVTACDKDNDFSDESLFYGVWVKGSNTGDTVEFYQKNGRNLMKSNQSFNPGMYAPRENEYKYEHGKLVMIIGAGSTFAEFPIESFTWKTRGRVFELNGFQLYLFMSSTLTKFEFQKVQ